MKGIKKNTMQFHLLLEEQEEQEEKKAVIIFFYVVTKLWMKMQINSSCYRIHQNILTMSQSSMKLY
jgi:ribosomal protein S26